MYSVRASCASGSRIFATGSSRAGPARDPLALQGNHANRTHDVSSATAACCCVELARHLARQTVVGSQPFSYIVCCTPIVIKIDTTLERSKHAWLGPLHSRKSFFCSLFFAVEGLLGDCEWMGRGSISGPVKWARGQGRGGERFPFPRVEDGERFRNSVHGSRVCAQAHGTVVCASPRARPCVWRGRGLCTHGRQKPTPSRTSTEARC